MQRDDTPDGACLPAEYKPNSTAKGQNIPHMALDLSLLAENAAVQPFPQLGVSMTPLAIYNKSPTGRGGPYLWSNYMDPLRVYALLQDACRALEQAGDHAVAAHVGHSMALIEEKYGIGHDHLDVGAVAGK